MKILKWSLPLTVYCACLAVADVAVAAEPKADQLSGARIFARVDAPLASRNLKWYCEALQGYKRTEEYRGYVVRACEAGIKTGVRKADQCSAPVLASEAEADYKECLAMDAPSFDATMMKMTEVRTSLVKALAERGIDGNALIANERAKLK